MSLEEDLMKILPALSLALMLGGCGGGSSPVAPSTPVAPDTPAPPISGSVTNWVVTQRFVSVTGPDNCWVREQRQRLTGAAFPDLPMVVTRSSGTIRLDGSFFQVNYAGTYSGSDVTAVGGAPLEGGGRPCQDGTSFTQMPGVSNLTGSFSADDQRATLTEVNTYRLTSGETVTYTWGWEATRRN
jgi:hypothetical protein